VIETDLALPDGLVSFVRLLLLDAAEWSKTRDKGKVPKPKPVDGPVLRILAVVLEKRLSEYSTSLEVRRVYCLSSALSLISCIYRKTSALWRI
jgi:N-lysine methyltransferase SETD6